MMKLNHRKMSKYVCASLGTAQASTTSSQSTITTKKELEQGVLPPVRYQS